MNGPNEGLCALRYSFYLVVVRAWKRGGRVRRGAAVARVQLLWAASLTGQLLTVVGQLWHATHKGCARGRGPSTSTSAGALLNALPQPEQEMGLARPSGSPARLRVCTHAATRGVAALRLRARRDLHDDDALSHVRGGELACSPDDAPRRPRGGRCVYRL